MKFGFVLWDVLSIIRAMMMMEAALTSETSVDNYFTRKYIPQDKSELQSLPFKLVNIINIMSQFKVALKCI
jgi:hypothetical protein